MRLAHRDAVLHPDVRSVEHTAAGTARRPSPPKASRGRRARQPDRARPGHRHAEQRPLGARVRRGRQRRQPRGDRRSRWRWRRAGCREPQALAALGTGLWVSNLWYLNYSDRPACRLTGLTRFACLWVEDGQPVEPIGVMRFDDSFLRMFGEGLVGLGDRAELIAESGTYLERQLGSLSTPGALVDGWRLTL